MDFLQNNFPGQLRFNDTKFIIMKIVISTLVVVFLIILTGFIFLYKKQGTEQNNALPDEGDIYPNALYPVRVNGKWGYMNRKMEIVIQPKFAGASDFVEGMASVEKEVAINGDKNEIKLLTGIIDTTGAQVVDFKYERIGEFSEGMAVVQKEGKFGFVDKSGKEVIPLMYEDAARFSEGLAAVKLNRKNGFINKKGEMVIEPQFERGCYVSVFSEGLAAVYTTYEDGPSGYIDKTGKWAIPPVLGFVDQFSEGLAMVRPVDSYDFGFINKKGEWVVKPQYDLSLSFHEGLAVVKVRTPEGKITYSIIDHSGKELVRNLNYQFVGIFKDGLAAFETVDYAWGYIDKTGKEVIPAKFSTPQLFLNGLARMETGSFFKGLKLVYINKKGIAVWKEK
jgi:hypothetical protein